MIKKLLVPIAIGLALFVCLDLVVSRLGLAGSSARNKQDAINRAVRVPHDIFHHALTPGFSGYTQWGRLVYRMHTNSLGFVDADTRTVAQKPAIPRLAIIGDSFGEGLGMEWKQTFAGILANANPKLEILNASVSSYSPIVYYRKIRWLLEQGYQVDHVLVMIDISDLQDETAYVMIDDKVAFRSAPPTTAANANAPPVAAPAPTPRGFSATALVEATERMLISLHLTSLALDLARAGFRGIAGYDLERVRNDCRSAWTYDKGNPSTEAQYQDVIGGGHVALATCQRRPATTKASATATDQPPGNIDRAIGRAQHWMSELHTLLAARGIPLSVGVYPWPATLHHDDRDSLYLRTWRQWCAGKCANFVDFFPEFFDYKAKNPRSWYRDLYIVGDVHYSALGNAMIARKLQPVASTIKQGETKP